MATITLSAEQERLIRARIENGEYPTAEAFVRDAVDRLIQEEEDLADARRAIEEAIEQSERGEGRPAREVFDEIRAKHGIPR